jgi:CBS domain-containing protein
MTRNPLWFDKFTTVEKASALLEFHDLDAAPVVDEHGRPIGVVTMDACAAWKEFRIRSSPYGFVSEVPDETTVEEIMRPSVWLVHEHDAIPDVIESLLEQGGRRAYVVNGDGELVGVISTTDVLRQLLASRDDRQAWGPGANSLN